RLGLPVRWADMECTLPPGKFDCVLMLESLEHVIEKQRLLRVLRLFATRLVMRTNCQDRSAQKTAFADTMHMISSSRLRELLDETGWRVVHWRDRRREAISSIVVWDRRLHRLGPTSDPHIEVFRAWTSRVLANRDAWVEANPLMEVVADA